MTPAWRSASTGIACGDGQWHNPMDGAPSGRVALPPNGATVNKPESPQNAAQLAGDGSLEDALILAASRHRGQRRKGPAGSPYILHPIAVATVLATEGEVDDADLLIAAVLHDTVEDTATSREELEELFGAQVAALVDEVSDDKSLPKAERKRLQVEHAAGASAAAKRLKIADKICNLRDLVTDPPAGWPAERRLGYVDWAAAVVAGCRGVSPRLEAAFDQAAAEARRAISD